MKGSPRTEEEKVNYQKRLNKISGQVNGISGMIKDDRHCKDILIQILAVNNAIKSLGQEILLNHMKTCMVSDIENHHYETIDEVMDLCRKLM
jgi:DNA-binding FrmR family transcriptional regulator